MAEEVVLTNAEVQPQKTTTGYKVVRLNMDVEKRVLLTALRGTNGELKEFTYTDQEALDLINAVSKANLTVKSLPRRIMEKLIADGHLTGAVSGTPD